MIDNCKYVESQIKYLINTEEYIKHSLNYFLRTLALSFIIDYCFLG